MDYKKKSLSNLKRNESYEEIDTRIASGWYVDALSGHNKKKFKTKEVVFKIAKKSKQVHFFRTRKFKLVFEDNLNNNLK